MRWICVVGGQKWENRRHIWASAGGKPINAANDALVNFSAAGKIRIWEYSYVYEIYGYVFEIFETQVYYGF